MVDKAKKDEKKSEVKTPEPKKKVIPTVNKHREGNLAYMKSVYPDTEISDDNWGESMNNAMGEHALPKLKRYDEANNNLMAMVGGEPELSKILADMAQGAKFTEVLPRYVDIENLKLAPGDPDYTKWQANNKQRKTDYQSSLDRKTQIENNQIKSQKTIEAFFSEKKMDDTAKKEYGSFVADLLDRAYAGELTTEFLNKMFHAKNYVDDVKTAEVVGTVKGKNEKIVTEEMKDKKKKQGDGLPDINGGNAREKETTPDTADEFTKSLRKITSRKPIIKGNRI